MLLVGDDDGAVGKLDLVARAVGHHLGRGHHAGGQAVVTDELVTDSDLPHGGPAGRCRQRGVQREGLTDTRARRDDDHLPAVQTVGDLVEIHEPGRDTARDATRGRDRVDLVHGGLQQVLERDEILGLVAAFGHVVDLGLRPVHDVGDIGTVGPGVAVLHHPGAGLDQATQQCLLGHDGGVVAGIGRGWHRGDQGVQIRRTADPAEQSAPIQIGGDGDRVGGLTAVVEIEDGLGDVLVRGAVEVAGLHLLQDVGDGVLGQQHAAEHGLLGRHVLRRLPADVLAGRFIKPRVTGMTEVVYDSHVASHLPQHSVEHIFDNSHRQATSHLRQAGPAATATANVRLCYAGCNRALLIDLWMACGQPRSAVLTGWGELVDKLRIATTPPRSGQLIRGEDLWTSSPTACRPGLTVRAC